jgi:hypothetical protein
MRTECFLGVVNAEALKGSCRASLDTLCVLQASAIVSLEAFRFSVGLSYGNLHSFFA